MNHDPMCPVATVYDDRPSTPPDALRALQETMKLLEKATAAPLRFEKFKDGDSLLTFGGGGLLTADFLYSLWCGIKREDAIALAAMWNLLRDHGPALLAALAPSHPATETRDFVLVPREPTTEMREAGKVAHHDAEVRERVEAALGTKGMCYRANRAAYVYAAMLAAAPKPATETGTGAWQPKPSRWQEAADAATAKGLRMGGSAWWAEIRRLISIPPTQDAAHGGRG